MKGFKYGNKITRFVFPRGLINHPLNYPTDFYYLTAYIEYSSSFIHRRLFYISDELWLYSLLTKSSRKVCCFILCCKESLLLLKMVFSVYSINPKEYLFCTAWETLYHDERETRDFQPMSICWTTDWRITWTTGEFRHSWDNRPEQLSKVNRYITIISSYSFGIKNVEAYTLDFKNYLVY